MTSYSQARLTPAVAVRLMPGLSAGLTLNAMYATMEYDVASGFGMVPRKSTSALGIGAVIGLQWSPLPIVTVGAAYETKSFFKDFEFDVPANNAFGQPFPGGKEKLAFDQPSMFTVGASVKPLPGFVFAADVEYVRWSETNGKNMPEFTTGNTTGYLPWNMGWKDQVVLKVGAELPVFPLVKLRLGYNYGKMPLDEGRAFENLAFPAVVESHFTGGLGVKVGPVAVNVSAVYSPVAKISGANASPPPDGQGLAAYQTKMSQIALDLGASMSF
jgi:long-chain fatty acid transport protein